mmetsp:Transcript_42967/g.93553  ORF Transcript_42967/g.93553 Transcript_42967/m.93553 type:complete len:210 (+) Transcript_42967:313-942(+)
MPHLHHSLPLLRRVGVKAGQILRQEVVVQELLLAFSVDLVKRFGECIQVQTGLVSLLALKPTQLLHIVSPVWITLVSPSRALDLALEGGDEAKDWVSNDAQAVSTLHKLLLLLLVMDKKKLRHSLVLPHVLKDVVDVPTVVRYVEWPSLLEDPRVHEVEHRRGATLCACTGDEVVLGHIIHEAQPAMWRLPKHFSTRFLHMHRTKASQG